MNGQESVASPGILAELTKMRAIDAMLSANEMTRRSADMIGRGGNNHKRK